MTVEFEVESESELELKPKKVLVPLDGSALSNAALPLVRTLARATHASVTLLRVMPRRDPLASLQAEEHLQKIAEELAGSGLTVASVVREGRAVDEILAQARALPAGLVVMRTRGRAGLERALLGSVTEQVLKHGDVPLVLMRPGERRVTAIRQLVVPVDGSPGGGLALDTAVKLARTTGASITLVQVAVPVATQVPVAYDMGGTSYYDPAWDDEILTSATDYVAATVEQLRANGLSVDGEAFTAPGAAEGIVEFADKHAADLVVMSTHALTGPARALMGSVADAVVRTAHCPVLLVRRRGALD
jgi:nucleotide-binding universal stress UspA family protein